MISCATLTSSAQAKDYHADHMVTGDYYDPEKSALAGWFGAGAEALGLRGQVGKEDYHALVDNRRPDGTKLTARDDAARRIGYDFTISPPKSVSVAALVNGDERVRAAHRAAVSAAMAELESFAAVRVRGAGEPAEDLARGHRVTGNIIGTFYEHETSRAAGNGITPDPQLHTHLVIFNATQDANGSFKALENYEMLRAQTLVNSVYEHRLCQELVKAGYAINETGPETWEIAGISDKEIDLFSKRHDAIQKVVNEEAEKNGVTDRKALAASVAQDKRIAKQPEATAKTLRADWLAQRGRLDEVAAPGAAQAERVEISAAEAVEFAKEKLFERSAVVKDVDLANEIFRRARGSSASIEEIKSALRDDPDLLRSADGRTVTTAAVLENESLVVAMVRDGKEKFAPLATCGLGGERAGKLTDRQREAAEIIITSTDFAVVFRGGAGVGKSFTLAAVKESVESGGGCICVIAPQNKQVFGLKNDGFFKARTLASFLNSKDGPPTGAVILVDEAGQIAGADMRRLLSAARRADCRVILSGDTRQHGPVGASDALLAIERYAGARTAELPADEETIQRQKVAWYKKAVSLADKGRTGESLDILESSGAVKESPDALAAAAAASLAAGQDGKSGLVVSQTNRAVETINGHIREQLKAEGRITVEREILGLRGVDCARAEMRRSGTYAGGNVALVAHSKADQFAAGEMLRFVREARGGIVATTEAGKEIKITARNLEKCMLVREEKISVGVGEKIQIRANLRLSDNKDDKMANGQIVTVSAISTGGALTVNDGKRDIELPKDFRQFSHGYAVTSYGSQGATVDKVIVADSGSVGASHKKEFYVSISRGKEAIEIHTQDKAGLRERIGATGERTLALDIVRPAKRFAGKDGREITRGLPDNPATPLRLQPARPAEKNTAGKNMTPEEAKKYDARQREEYNKRQTADAGKRKDDTLKKAREMRPKKSAGVSPEIKNTRGYKDVQMEHAGNMSLVESDRTKAAADRAGELIKLRAKDKGKLSPEHAAELKMSLRHAQGRDLDKGIPEFRKSNELREKRESAAKIGRLKKAAGIAPKKPTSPGLAPSKKTNAETLKTMRKDPPAKKPESKKRTL